FAKHTRAGAADGARRPRARSLAARPGKGLRPHGCGRCDRPRGRVRADAIDGISPLSGESARSVVVRVLAGRDSLGVAYGMPRAGVAGDTNRSAPRAARLT